MADWIPTSERMPDTEEPVLFAWVDRGMRRVSHGSYYGQQWFEWVWVRKGATQIHEPVTHWMPLPAHPDAKEEPRDV